MMSFRMSESSKSVFKRHSVLLSNVTQYQRDPRRRVHDMHRTAVGRMSSPSGPTSDQWMKSPRVAKWRTSTLVVAILVLGYGLLAAVVGIFQGSALSVVLQLPRLAGGACLVVAWQRKWTLKYKVRLYVLIAGFVLILAAAIASSIMTLVAAQSIEANCDGKSPAECTQLQQVNQLAAVFAAILTCVCCFACLPCPAMFLARMRRAAHQEYGFELHEDLSESESEDTGSQYSDEEEVPVDEFRL
jgi:hypothetical protein